MLSVLNCKIFPPQLFYYYKLEEVKGAATGLGFVQ